MKQILLIVTLITHSFIFSSNCLFPEHSKNLKQIACNETSVPIIVCSETQITITHSMCSKRIELRSERHEILYQKYNHRDTETRIHTSMYPHGTYYICIDSYLYLIVL